MRVPGSFFEVRRIRIRPRRVSVAVVHLLDDLADLVQDLGVGGKDANERGTGDGSGNLAVAITITIRITIKTFEFAGI